MIVTVLAEGKIVRGNLVDKTVQLHIEENDSYKNDSAVGNEAEFSKALAFSP